jgi:hypothetical protein
VSASKLLFGWDILRFSLAFALRHHARRDFTRCALARTAWNKRGVPRVIVQEPADRAHSWGRDRVLPPAITKIASGRVRRSSSRMATHMPQPTPRQLVEKNHAFVPYKCV